MEENKPYSPEQTVPSGNQYVPNPSAANQQFNQNQSYNQNQAYNQGQPYVQPVRATVYDTMPMKNNNIAICGLVVGIFALIGFWVPFIDLILSIAGIVCSGIGLSKQNGSKGISIGGLVGSIIALLLSLIFMVIYIIALAL